MKKILTPVFLLILGSGQLQRQGSHLTKLKAGPEEALEHCHHGCVCCHVLSSPPPAW
jgi:hypothetical protein